MKKLVITILAVVLTVSAPFLYISYADTEAETPSSAEVEYSYENEGAEGTASEGEEDADFKESQTIIPASDPPEEIFSGGVGKEALLSPLLSESFQTDLATGSATASIPIVVPPGRKGMQPKLALTYSSNNPNGVCGVGWDIPTLCIQRSTKNGTPVYDNSNTFVFNTGSSGGELVLIDAANNEYRQRIETDFMKYVFDANGKKWTVWDKTGTKYIFGKAAGSRITDPADESKIFAWFLDRVEDIYGNSVLFEYIKGSSQVYMSKIEYTKNDAVDPVLEMDKTVEFIYDVRKNQDEEEGPDIIYSHRSGWEIATDKRLIEIDVKVDDGLVWKYVLDYGRSADTGRSLLSKITLFDSAGNSLPPKTFKYQTVE